MEFGAQAVASATFIYGHSQTRAGSLRYGRTLLASVNRVAWERPRTPLAKEASPPSPPDLRERVFGRPKRPTCF